MLRSSSTLWANHPAKRACMTASRSACANCYKPFPNTGTTITPFKTRTYTSASIPPPQSNKWKWVVAPALVAGAAYMVSKKDDDKKHKDERFDTEKLYATKTTAEIAFSWVILKLCSYDFVVNYGPRLLQWAEKYLIIPFA